MTVLLTGGAGFIGSHVAEAYVAEGFSVVIIDNFCTGKKENLEDIYNHPQVVVYEEDINNLPALQKIVERHRPHIINHHAAQKSVPYSIENPKHDAQENIMGLLNLLQVAKETGIQSFIFASTGGALMNKGEIADENEPESFLSPYAITKFASEKYIELYAKLYQFDYTILRYSNVYGTRQTEDGGECGVIPIFVNNIFNNRASTLFAYPDMPKGCIRDYVYVSDVARANMLASLNPINDRVNISGGEGLYIKEIYQLIQQVFETSMDIKTTGPRQNDVKISILSNEKAEKLLKWKPRVTLEQGLKEIRKSYAL